MSVNLGPLMWADPVALADDTGADHEIAEIAVREASWALWILSGRKLHAAGERRETYELVYGGRSVVHLMRPLIEVDLVKGIHPLTKEEIVIVEPDWYLIGRRLYVPIQTGILLVEYTVGSNLPPGTIFATETLAREYINARLGKKCRLPERITSVSRTGVSWTVFDPNDIIKQGMSGIPQIDTWLALNNPTQQRQVARVIDARRPRMLEGLWLDAVNVNEDVDDIPGS
jgi:hypothetical protein